MPIHWTLALMLVATSVVTAVLALFGLSAFGARRPQHGPAFLRQDDRETVFLFDEDVLIDASDSARALLASCPPRDDDWGRLCAFLAPKFEAFEDRMHTLAEAGRMELTGLGEAPLRLFAEMRGGLARLVVFDPATEGRGLYVDSLSQRASEEELAALRKTTDEAPLLMWREDGNGRVIWANKPYLMMLGTAPGGEDALSWPLPALFEPLPLAEASDARKRLRLERPQSNAPLWYERTSFAEKTGILHFAVPADDTVRAETALREFIQTLTKTFAHLPIGLAIFDRQRQLALFNPALIDLTTLGPEFLSGRPTLVAFLDRLREKRMMPEPKDYRSWRQKLTELEQAATSGYFEETWTLPGGQTYKVIGRPHPDGAIAFLFEDITAEMSLTRRFRTELELGQEVVDSLDEAIAVFSPAGVLILSNAAYAKLWGIDPGVTLGEIGVTDSVRHWQALTRPNALWSDLHECVTEMDEINSRSEWTRMAEMKDGRRMSVRVRPLSGGATLVGFAEAPLSRLIRRARVRSMLRESI